VFVESLFFVDFSTDSFSGGMAYIKKLCFIGHRPEKLGGYNRNPISDYVKMALRGAIERAIKRRVETFISGGALGVDQWAAEIVLDIQAKEIKKSYGGFSEIKLNIALPFPSQPAKWPQDAKRHYDKILQKAYKIIAVKDDPYAPWKIQARNEWMVDNSDAVIAVWSGLSGRKFMDKNVSDLGQITQNPYRILENQLTRKMCDGVKVSLQFRKVVARSKRRQMSGISFQSNLWRLNRI
jgi:uncharacterized phage-like protein YoqJ